MIFESVQGIELSFTFFKKKKYRKKKREGGCVAFQGINQIWLFSRVPHRDFMVTKRNLAKKPLVNLRKIV